MSDESIRVGDRVMVCPQSAYLDHLNGAWGTVEKVIPEDAEALGGALYVRMDLDGRTVGFGPDAVTGVERHA